MSGLSYSNFDIPGSPPPSPCWGQEMVQAGPELKRRIKIRPGAEAEAVIVLGAGGAFAPELLHSLRLQGTGLIIGLDVQLTYVIEGVTYRNVDLCDFKGVRKFFSALESVLSERELKLTTIYDLSTTQTSPTSQKDREILSQGKEGLLDVLCESESDIRLLFMSTAEVYGAPEGAPYNEEHCKRPFNAYGRHKLYEEEQVLKAHNRQTRGGTLKTAALRCWTICMVNVDEDGEVLSTRNYNDPFVMVAQKLSSAGVRVPVIGRNYEAQFHLAEEVAEVCVLLGSAPIDSNTWSGQAFNCVGTAATHTELREVCFDVFSERDQKRPWWGVVARGLLGGGSLPKPLFTTLARGLELAGGLLGARDLGGRLPFLYRSTHMNTSKLEELLGAKLTQPEGSSSEEAVRRLALGICNGGDDALNMRRYQMY